MTSYLDVETLFPRFGLPMRLAAEGTGAWGAEPRGERARQLAS